MSANWLFQVKKGLVICVFTGGIWTGALAEKAGSAPVSDSCAVQQNAEAKRSVMENRIGQDYGKFLARHDMVWERAPRYWGDAPFLGNGTLGLMIFQSGGQSLQMDIGRADYYGHRDPSGGWLNYSRMPIGHFTLETVAPVQSFKGRLDLWNAEFTGVVVTAQGTVKLRALVHSQRMVMIVDLETSGSENNCRIVWHPDEAVPPNRSIAIRKLAQTPRPAGKEAAYRFYEIWAAAKYDPNPPFGLGKADGIDFCKQPLLEGGGTTTAWCEDRIGDGRRRFYVSIAHTYPQDISQTEAVETVNAVRGIAPEELIKSHRQWWHEYYPASFISLPDAYWEGFYWIQMYKLGSATRPDGPLIDVIGPWYQETTWPLVWFNLNVQLTYWCVADANRLDMGESLIGRFERNRDTLIANMPENFGGECAGLSTTTAQDLKSKWTIEKSGDFPWAMHNCWMLMRRSMDEKRMKEQFFPLLKMTINTYYKILPEEGSDGKQHLPKTFSPEIGYAEDANYNLALFRWGCRTLVDLCQRFNIEDPMLPKWKTTLERLVDFPADETGFMIGKDFPLTIGHRHFSHLLMIYPLYLVNVEQPGGRELIEKSLRHWIGLQGGAAWPNNYTWTGASSMASALGDGNLALEYLNKIKKNGTKLTCTTMQDYGQPAIEAPLAAAQSIHDMLLQSWGDKIRIFPAVPDVWRDVCFHDLRAEGAFLVSASRKDGKTQWVRVKSLAGEPCRVKTDMTEPVLAAAGSALKPIGDGVYELILKKGEEAVLVPGNCKDTAVIVAAVELAAGVTNCFGLK